MFPKIPRARIYWSMRLTLQSLAILLSGGLVKGGAIERFREALRKYLGCRYVILTSCGKISLYATLKVLKLDESDEVILPAYTVPEVVEVILACNLVPVFVDIDETTYNMNEAAIEAAIGTRSKVILMTHMYGRPCNVDCIMALAKKYHLSVIEDAAQTIGAEYNGKKVGTFGRAGYFSFGMMKHFNTLGGSALVTDDPMMYRDMLSVVEKYPYPTQWSQIKLLCKAMMLHIATNSIVFSICGYPIVFLLRLFGKKFLYNALAGRPIQERFSEDFLDRVRHRFANLQGAIGLMQLRSLERNNEARVRNAGILNDILQLPHSTCTNHIYSQYVLLFKDREEAAARLFNEGIDVTNGYLENCGARFSDGKRNDSFIKSSLAEQHNLYIPIYPSLTERRMKGIALCIQKMYGHIAIL
ncbi:MAG: DegT/DnrJ/EryC1/StrS family aminotransferase [Candidatus Omnitrophica bacterium]|nr:DegT/DnrJ/EryC1/StrS family aminotransferase [Candidatus Omnitrophota bacterium]